MPRPNAVNDNSLPRLHALALQLKERLEEAEDVRARLTKARAANVWPDMRLATQVLVDANRAH